jgi:hypothetical protein
MTYLFNKLLNLPSYLLYKYTEFKCRKINIHYTIDTEISYKLITKTINDHKPVMIARFGATELSCLSYYLSIKKSNILIKYIDSRFNKFWWNSNILFQLQNNSGFFPLTKINIDKYCKLLLKDMRDIDILGSWLKNENIFYEFINHTVKIHFLNLEPFWSKLPWTSVLQDKNVLIIHPFSEDISKQYFKRNLLFKNQDVLPQFKNLIVIKAIQSLGNGDNRFIDWFDALDYMKSQINNVDFDICLIGCGAYGLHLAAHVKNIGKKAVHMGGSLQLLFGIKGKRWEDPNYGVKEYGLPYGSYLTLMNEHWIYPSHDTIPINADKIENSCYW